MSNRQVLELSEKNVPKGWVLTKIQDAFGAKTDIVAGPFGSSLKATEYVNEGIPLIRLQNVERCRFINKNIRYITVNKAEQLKSHSFSKNDIVVTKLGDPLGKACIVPEYLEYGIVVADVIRMRTCDKLILKKFLMYLINSDSVIKQFMVQTKGTTRPRVNLTKFRQFVIPLAPRQEQERIVSKIESIFAKIDKTETLLKAIHARNKQLRQVVLKRAFEGKLVPQDPSDEPASVLLKRISPNVKPVDDLKSESNLPRGWIIIKINEISVINPRKPETGLIDDGFKVSFIPMKCVGELTGKVDLSTTRAYAEVKKNYTYFINDDIIFAKITPCMENGKVAIMRGLKNGIGFGSTEFHVIRLKDTLNRKFYFRYLMQDGFRDSAQSNMKGTAGQLRVPADYLKNALVPIPPINEQKRIVSKIESIFARIDAIDEHITKLLSMLAMLRKSVLKHAFEGRLVPQDPNDEPAYKLLEQVRGARHA